MNGSFSVVAVSSKKKRISLLLRMRTVFPARRRNGVTLVRFVDISDGSVCAARELHGRLAYRDTGGLQLGEQISPAGQQTASHCAEAGSFLARFHLRLQDG